MLHHTVRSEAPRTQAAHLLAEGSEAFRVLQLCCTLRQAPVDAVQKPDGLVLLGVGLMMPDTCRLTVTTGFQRMERSIMSLSHLPRTRELN
jgi:hypothetical protein